MIYTVINEDIFNNLLLENNIDTFVVKHMVISREGYTFQMEPTLKEINFAFSYILVKSDGTISMPNLSIPYGEMVNMDDIDSVEYWYHRFFENIKRLKEISFVLIH